MENAGFSHSMSRMLKKGSLIKKKNRKILSQNGNFKNLGNREEIHF